jgi:hypothetical protein
MKTYIFAGEIVNMMRHHWRIQFFKMRGQVMGFV